MPPERAARERWIADEREDGVTVLYLQGAWRLPNLPAVAAEIGALSLTPDRPCVLDGSRLETLDTATLFMLLSRLGAAGYTRATVSIRRVQDRHARLLAMVHERMATPAASAPSRHLDVLQRLGVATLRAARDLEAHTRFLGIVAAECLAVLRRPRTFRWQATVTRQVKLREIGLQLHERRVAAVTDPVVANPVHWFNQSRNLRLSRVLERSFGRVNRRKLQFLGTKRLTNPITKPNQSKHWLQEKREEAT